MTTDLESLLKIAMFFQKRTKVDDYLRRGYPQVQNSIIHRFRRL